MFFELRSISRLFGPFRALLNVLPVSELYSRKAFLAVDVRYRDNTGQNEAKKSAPGALKAKRNRNMTATRFSDSATRIPI